MASTGHRQSTKRPVSIVLTAAVALVAAACAGQTPPERSSIPELTSPTTSAAPAPRASAVFASEDPGDILIGDLSALGDVQGRLLILDNDRLLVMRPDGTDLSELPPVSHPQAVQRAPTWSPDGTNVAWTETTPSGEAFLVTANPDGTDVQIDVAPFAAGYLAWDPTARRIAFMGSDVVTGGLRLAQGMVGSPAEVIASGMSLFFDWDAGGEGIVVHTSDRFQYIPVDGSVLLPIAADGDFRMGAHIGSELIFSVAADLGEVLSVGTLGSTGHTELLRYGAPAAYVVNPDEARLATMSLPSIDGTALAGLPAATLPILPPEQLTVLDVDTRTTTMVTGERTIAWFWSPDGTRLLYGTAPTVDGSLRLQWHMWDGATTTHFDVVTPSATYAREYLALFDQVDRSISFWSPDGSAFVFAGQPVGAPPGIWVQPTDGSDLLRVSSGSVAVWSPT